MSRSTSARVTWLLALAALCSVPSSVIFAQNIRVTPLTREDQVLVSFEVPDAFNDQVREAIQSGLPTTFTYDIQLKREATVWLDRTIASARVTATVRFDNLTRRYQVTVLRDGRTEVSRTTENEEVVREMVTLFQRLPLFSTRVLEPNGEYYVRVQAKTRPRNVLFFLPWDRDGAFGSATFTFLPQ